MKEYDALETAYKNGFEAGYKSRDQKRGTWELDEITLPHDRTMYAYRCSECDNRVFAPSPYCPYCGTKMNMEE